MSHHCIVVLALVALALGACRGEPAPPPRAEPPAAPRLAAGTQADLARELDAAEHTGTWSEVRRRWQGQRLRWHATRYSAMCRVEGACNVAVFPIQRPAAHGWMPRLGFAPGQFDALVAACGTREPCEVTFEGTLVELDASGERATKLRFDNVTLASASLAAK